MRNAKIAIGAVVALVVLAVGGTWVYINVIKDDAPEKLSLDDTSTTTAAATGDSTTTAPTGSPGTATDGDWSATGESVVGYRAKEVLFGQSTEGVGRTSKVTGKMTISGTSVDTASFEVDMTSLESDESNRDNQFNGRIMETSKFPTATFELTSPIDLGSVPDDGKEITATAAGKLTLKDRTNDVTLDITAKRSGSTVSVLTSYRVVFADWGIDDPSFGPAKVEDNALLEVKLVFQKA